MSGDSLQSVAPVFPVEDISARRAGGVWDAYLQGAGLSRLWDRVSELPDARGPEERWYGQREVEVRDPNGYLLVFAERTEGGED